MSFWRGQPTCKVQGSIIIKEAFTIRLQDHSDGTADLALTAGTVYDSVDDFLGAWQTVVNAAGFSGTYTIEVLTSGANKGFVSVSNTSGHNVSITWAHAGDATEAARVAKQIGQIGNISNQAEPVLLQRAHRAGFYPTFPPSDLSVSSVSFDRAQGITLKATAWAQSAPMVDDHGRCLVAVEFQIDGSTDWQELYDLKLFFDDVFDDQYVGGAHFTIFNVPAGDATGDRYTGHPADVPLEIMSERVHEGHNGLLRAGFRMEAGHVPNLDD